METFWANYSKPSPGSPVTQIVHDFVSKHHILLAVLFQKLKVSNWVQADYYVEA